LGSSPFKLGVIKLSAYLKPVLVLLVSIFILAVISFLTEKEFVDFVENGFYNPSVVKTYVRENTKDAEIAQDFIFELQNKFARTLDEPAIRRSFLYNQRDEDIYERSMIYGTLLESTVGLQSVKFVDSNGLRIHYSTLSGDIISRDSYSTIYRNYTDDPAALPYGTVSVHANGSAKFTMDERNDRIIFSFPFIDSMDVGRGTAFFSVSVGALAERLVAAGRIKISDDVSVIRTPPGILLGSPYSSKINIFNNVSRIWSNGIQGRTVLDADDSGVIFSLITFKTDNGLFFGRLVNDTLFSVSGSMKIVLYLSMFLTFYLVLFFLINLRPHALTVVRTRLERLRENLFEQLYVNKSSQERVKWVLELEQRREEIRLELKNNLKMNSRTEKEIDGIIDKSWDDLLAVMKAGSLVSPPPAEATVVKPSASKTKKIEKVEELEELEKIEEAEEPDEDIPELEIVSPFSSMFSSLDTEKKDEAAD